jgi:hypothetical protein
MQAQAAGSQNATGTAALRMQASLILSVLQMHIIFHCFWVLLYMLGVDGEHNVAGFQLLPWQ